MYIYIYNVDIECVYIYNVYALYISCICNAYIMYIYISYIYICIIYIMHIYIYNAYIYIYIHTIIRAYTYGVLQCLLNFIPLQGSSDNIPLEQIARGEWLRKLSYCCKMPRSVRDVLNKVFRLVGVDTVLWLQPQWFR